MTKRKPEVAAFWRGKPCVVCGSVKTVADHIQPFKRSEKYDIIENTWPLCVFGAGNGHHEEKEAMPLSEFIKKYSLEGELLKRGFEYCQIRGKWFLPIIEG